MTTPPTISKGATGPRGQVGPVASSPSNPELRSGGVFGLVTKMAAEQFQRNSLLTVDGIVRTATWAALGGYGAGPLLPQDRMDRWSQKLQTTPYEGRDDFAPGSDLMLAVGGIYGRAACPAQVADQALHAVGH